MDILMPTLTFLLIEGMELIQTAVNEVFEMIMVL